MASNSPDLTWILVGPGHELWEHEHQRSKRHDDSPYGDPSRLALARPKVADEQDDGQGSDVVGAGD